VSDLEEGGYDPSHHLAQEGIGRDVDRHERSCPPDSDRVNGPHRLPVRYPEGAEVVAAHQDRPGPLHRGSIQWVPHPERKTLAERASRPVPYGVAILPISRRVAWVEPGRDAPHLSDCHVHRQQSVERPGQFLRGPAPRVGECDHLPDCMDTCVGSTRRYDSDLASA